MAAERELGMSQIHRKHINDYIENLIKCTTYDSLAYECVNSGLITQVMRENLEKRNTESHNISEEEEKINRHRRLFIKITKRGPRAYTQLRQICYAHFPLASTILENVGSVPQGSTILDNRPFLSLNSLNSHCSAHSSVNSYTNSTNSFSSDDSLKSPDHVDTHSTFNSGAVKSTYVTTVSTESSPFSSFLINISSNNNAASLTFADRAFRSEKKSGTIQRTHTKSNESHCNEI